VFNMMYYATHGYARGKLTDCESFFYPLDELLDWNRLYGRRGFVQYQVAFPPQTARAGLLEILGRVSQSSRASFLAVLKSFGESGPGLLSFPMKGFTLALDIPAARGLEDFLRSLDEITLRHSGRLYLAKDSAASAETFAGMYPNLSKFREIKQRLDPENRLSSSQARRLGIVI
jgi:FAD/FMN-containing dehydrogenase